MYITLLTLALVALVLSPIALDWFLNRVETRRERLAMHHLHRQNQQLAWALRNE